MTCEEYDLLLRLNQITIAKYNDMAKLSGGLTEVAQRLNEKCKFTPQVLSVRSSVLIKVTSNLC